MLTSSESCDLKKTKTKKKYRYHAWLGYTIVTRPSKKQETIVDLPRRGCNLPNGYFFIFFFSGKVTRVRHFGLEHKSDGDKSKRVS